MYFKIKNIFIIKMKTKLFFSFLSCNTVIKHEIAQSKSLFSKSNKYENDNLKKEEERTASNNERSLSLQFYVREKI